MKTFDGLKVAVAETWGTSYDQVLDQLRGFYPSLVDMQILGAWSRASDQERASWKSSAVRLLGDRAADLAGDELTRFGATHTLVERIVVDQVEQKTGMYFSPAGGGNPVAHGLEQISDQAWAALRLTEAGLRTVYLDLDGHQADAVELTLEGRADILTVSINEFTPGGSTTVEAGNALVRLALGAGGGDHGFVQLNKTAAEHLEAAEPDVLIINLGADILEGDPSSSMEVSLGAVAEALRQAGAVAARRDASVLILGGGAPTVEASTLWAVAIATLTSEVLVHQLGGTR